MLGGDYFRDLFSDNLDAASVAVDLRNALLSGFNTLRFYGFPAQELQSSPDLLALLRQTYKAYGLRVLFCHATKPWQDLCSMPCYKDPAQTGRNSVISRTAADASILAKGARALLLRQLNLP